LLSSGYMGRVFGDLAESGYNCRWRVLSAAEAGAPHKRDRLWIALADTERERPQRRGEEWETSGQVGLCSGNGQNKKQDIRGTGSWWKAEPDVGRVANGVASRMDRLKAIGNGQVPAVVRKAWDLLA